MKNILTSLSAAFETFVATLNDTRAAIYAEANTRKAALAKAVADMQEADEVMQGFVSNMNMLADAAEEFGEDMGISEEHVHTMVSDMDVYESPVEEFEGLCDQCGKELRRNDDQYMDDDCDGWICADCEHQNHPEPEIEGQMTIDEITNEEEA